ncbi:MAG TPA: tol-pal system protein YbgF [Nitrospiraceae bacterium]|nr:tol-pal system protein YbgF [Nitrospiraceae bacterium]
MSISARTRSIMQCALIVVAFSSCLAFPSGAAAAPGAKQDIARHLYDRVMDEFRQKDYEAALAGFRFFMELHGHSILAGNAQYWIGECEYRLGRYKDALTTFYNVISYYPLSPKLPASTLRIGQIYTKLRDKEKARMMYERVVDQYPDMAEAEVARRALEQAAPKDEPVTGE